MAHYPNAPGCLCRGPRPPSYDFRMELLATIPYAVPVPAKMLADDFRLPLRECWEILQKLEDRFGILLTDTGAVIPRGPIRDRVELACETYWSRAWGSRAA